jgi:hypothetical protein
MKNSQRGSDAYGRDKDKAKRAIVAQLVKREPRTASYVESKTYMTKTYVLRLLRELRDEGRVLLVARNAGWVRT